MKKQKNHSEIYKIDGVGVNLERFKPLTIEEKNEFRKTLGLSENDFVITIVAEMNKNKNQIMLIRKVPELLKVIPSLKILLVGKETLPDLHNYVDENNLNDCVKFLGYRTDIEKITGSSDVSFSASIREGLPVNIIEAMACGIPCVCSKNRGHNSLVKDKETGFIFSLDSDKEMMDAIILLYKNPSLKKEMGDRNILEAKKFSLDNALASMTEIYRKFMDVENSRGGVLKYSINFTKNIGGEFYAA